MLNILLFIFSICQMFPFATNPLVCPPAASSGKLRLQWLALHYPYLEKLAVPDKALLQTVRSNYQEFKYLPVLTKQLRDKAAA